MALTNGYMAVKSVGIAVGLNAAPSSLMTTERIAKSLPFLSKRKNAPMESAYSRPAGEGGCDGALLIETMVAGVAAGLYARILSRFPRFV